MSLLTVAPYDPVAQTRWVGDLIKLNEELRQHREDADRLERQKQEQAMQQDAHDQRRAFEVDRRFEYDRAQNEAENADKAFWRSGYVPPTSQGGSAASSVAGIPLPGASPIPSPSPATDLHGEAIWNAGAPDPSQSLLGSVPDLTATDPNANTRDMGNSLAAIPPGEAYPGMAPETPSSLLTAGSGDVMPLAPPGSWQPVNPSAQSHIGKVTDYGQKNDPSGDHASLGTGAFKVPTGAWQNPLRETSLAVSPDIESQFRAAGIKPLSPVVLHLADGTAVTKTWDDRTAQDDQIARGEVPNVTQPLRGRFDFFSPGGKSPMRDAAVVGFSPASAPTQGDLPTNPGGVSNALFPDKTPSASLVSSLSQMDQTRENMRGIPMKMALPELARAAVQSAKPESSKNAVDWQPDGSFKIGSTLYRYNAEGTPVKVGVEKASERMVKANEFDDPAQVLQVIHDKGYDATAGHDPQNGRYFIKFNSISKDGPTSERYNEISKWPTENGKRVDPNDPSVRFDETVGVKGSRFTPSASTIHTRTIPGVGLVKINPDGSTVTVVPEGMRLPESKKVEYVSDIQAASDAVDALGKAKKELADNPRNVMGGNFSGGSPGSVADAQATADKAVNKVRKWQTDFPQLTPKAPAAQNQPASVDPRAALAQAALNDPNASEEHKAAARKILGL